MPDNLLNGILIGAGGGAGAGIILWILSRANNYEIERRERKRIYEYLDKNTVPNHPKWKWRSTRTIASYTNLTDDRVRYLCSKRSKHEKIVRSTGEREVWGINGRARDDSQTGIVQG